MSTQQKSVRTITQSTAEACAAVVIQGPDLRTSFLEERTVPYSLLASTLRDHYPCRHEKPWSLAAIVNDATGTEHSKPFKVWNTASGLKPSSRVWRFPFSARGGRQ
jgi:hypothetical protein